MTVEYHPAVEAELEEIRNFYEGRRPGLGREFIDEFERLVGREPSALARVEWWYITQRVGLLAKPAQDPHLIAGLFVAALGHRIRGLTHTACRCRVANQKAISHQR